MPSPGSAAGLLPRGLRLLVFDRTCRWPRLPLTHAWRSGLWLYRGLGRIDLGLGASSWEEALGWLATVELPRRLDEVQIWSHGRWGRALLDADSLDLQALLPGHRLQPLLAAVRQRLSGPQALLWFRTCETFGADSGQQLARSLCDFLGCRTAGHTHIIGFWQSGLHSLGPGETPGWSAEEGIARGSAAAPAQARPSSPFAPNTISCLSGRIPRGY